MFPDLFSVVLMGQLRCLGPPPSRLKLSQISNFLTGVGSLVSKWSEKVKKLPIGLYLASKWSKPISEMAFFLKSPNIFDFVSMILKSCSSLQIEFYFSLVIWTQSNPHQSRKFKISKKWGPEGKVPCFDSAKRGSWLAKFKHVRTDS